MIAPAATRALALLSTLAVVFAVLTVPAVVAAPPVAAAADSTIALTKSAPASVLAGSPVPYTLTATNPANAANAAPQYNVSFRDVLAPGCDLPARFHHPRRYR